MKEIYLIMEDWNKNDCSQGYVNSVYNDLAKAKEMAKKLKDAWSGNENYYNWIITRPLY